MENHNDAASEVVCLREWPRIRLRHNFVDAWYSRALHCLESAECRIRAEGSLRQDRYRAREFRDSASRDLLQAIWNYRCALPDRIKRYGNPGIDIHPDFCWWHDRAYQLARKCRREPESLLGLGDSKGREAFLELAKQLREESDRMRIGCVREDRELTEFLNPKEVAELCQVDERTARRWCQKKAKACRNALESPGGWLVPRLDVIDYAASQKA